MPPKSVSSLKRKATSPAAGEQTTLASFFAKPPVSASTSSGAPTTSKQNAPQTKSHKPTKRTRKEVPAVIDAVPRGSIRLGPDDAGVIDLMSDDDDDDDDIVETGNSGKALNKVDTPPRKLKKEDDEGTDEVTGETDEGLAQRLGREELLLKRLSPILMANTEAVEDLTVEKLGPPPSNPPTRTRDSNPKSVLPQPAFSIFDKPSSPSKTQSAHFISSGHAANNAKQFHQKSLQSNVPKSRVVPLPKEYPDLDVDPLLFDPASIDTSYWPDGRVPYAFLVGAGFVRVGSTKKRLIIGRIITKYILISACLTW